MVNDHYTDVIMGAIASQITSLPIVYSTVYSDADQRKPQSSASLAFMWGIHRGPGTSPPKWPVTRKMFPFDDVIMYVLDNLVCNRRIIHPGRQCIINMGGKASWNLVNIWTQKLQSFQPRGFYIAITGIMLSRNNEWIKRTHRRWNYYVFSRYCNFIFKSLYVN